jgi:tRNA1(Val) A37 N6-methylase TrmN6
LRLHQPARGYRAGIDPVLLAAACPAATGDRVLDCGAGIGTVGLCVARRIEGAHVTLVEREAAYVKLARANVVENALSDRVDVVDTDGTRAADPLKDAANAMPEAALDDWARFMAAMVRPGGTATVIHRADALELLLGVFTGRFGGVTIRPVHPRHDRPANRVLFAGVKGSRARLTILPPLVLHATDGAYTAAVEAVLRAPNALA